MKEVNIADKQKYLKDNYPFEPVPNISEKRRCLHCGIVFTISDYKVFKDIINGELIYCPDAPECDGTAIDWIDAD
ncbi:hypothetical protein [Ferruginibacter albus]|uniref:hypothetical protein n=1 Tax=Ferruginibacter albus TaxID=2875540 RepID=UPI001CC5A66F|nr:hypothetical protein [Ferruginibacter albus]UAY53208.1 hypothetical protein K9M53_05935 [Ferruginibacter albus]